MPLPGLTERSSASSDGTSPGLPAPRFRSKGSPVDEAWVEISGAFRVETMALADLSDIESSAPPPVALSTKSRISSGTTPAAMARRADPGRGQLTPGGPPPAPRAPEPDSALRRGLSSALELVAQLVREEAAGLQERAQALPGEAADFIVERALGLDEQARTLQTMAGPAGPEHLLSLLETARLLHEQARGLHQQLQQRMAERAARPPSTRPPGPPPPSPPQWTEPPAEPLRSLPPLPPPLRPAELLLSPHPTPRQPPGRWRRLAVQLMAAASVLLVLAVATALWSLRRARVPAPARASARQRIALAPPAPVRPPAPPTPREAPPQETPPTPLATTPEPADPPPAEAEPLSPALLRLRKQLERCKLPGTEAEVLQQVGDAIETRLDLGACAARAGHLEEAVRHYEIVLSRRSDEPWALLGLARAHERAGALAQALSWYLRYEPVSDPALARKVKASIRHLRRKLGP